MVTKPVNLNFIIDFYNNLQQTFLYVHLPFLCDRNVLAGLTDLDIIVILTDTLPENVMEEDQEDLGVSELHFNHHYHYNSVDARLKVNSGVSSKIGGVGW